MKNEKFNFNFCGLDEKCALCNGHDCPGYGDCHILRAKADKLSEMTEYPVIYLFNTLEADMMSSEEFWATHDALPEEVEILFTFDFEPEVEIDEDVVKKEEKEWEETIRASANECSGYWGIERPNNEELPF